MKITLLSAGAGSGKTFQLTQILHDRLSRGVVRPDAIIGTTFTVKAAAELTQRVRQKLLAEGRRDDVNRIGASLIGTVNSVCQSLLERYAFEAGMSPALTVIDEKQAPLLFNQILEDAIDRETFAALSQIARRFGYEDGQKFEWRDSIRRIVDLARANVISTSSFKDNAKSSLEKLFSFFPGRTKDDLGALLRSSIEETIRVIDASGDATKVTAKYRADIQNSLRPLQYGDLTWARWVSLSKGEASAKLRAQTQVVRDAAGRFGEHPRLHDDLKIWVETCFAVAARALEGYQAEKERRGFTDFIDQEQRCLLLLDNPRVKEDLAKELDLLLVDEFQDTSPIQLALFTKLCRLAKESVWVGDPKQAIYGFRGTDPELMDIVSSGMKGRDGDLTEGFLSAMRSQEEVEIDTDTLDTSRRSVEPLVRLVNELFVPAFADILPKSEVELQPHRKDAFAEPPLEFWTLEGRSSESDANLAAGIEALIASKRPVFDKRLGRRREITPSDIAVLCRTNGACQKLAESLSDRGIAADVKRPGLLVTREARLALAYLSFAVDRTDSMSQAVIVMLQSGKNPGEWLGDRIQHVSSDEKWEEWGASGPVKVEGLSRLKDFRERLRHLSPTEVLVEVLELGDVRKSVMTWGGDEHAVGVRLANLDLLAEVARSYEDRCSSTSAPATIPGLLKWFSELHEAKEDFLASSRTGNAVCVMTYHRAKGLEWPVVICCALDFKIRRGHWEVNVESTKEPSFEDPLAGRRIRYWPWAFGNHAKDVDISDRSIADPIGVKAYDSSVRESKRLLYVAFTRARDQLICVIKGQMEKQEWLGSLDAGWFEPGKTSLRAPSGYEIPCRTRNLVGLGDAPSGQAPSLTPFWFETTPVAPRLPLHLSPSRLASRIDAQILRQVEIGTRLELGRSVDMALVGSAIHDAMALYLMRPDRSDFEREVQRLIKNYRVAGMIEAGGICRAARDFARWLNSMGCTKLHPEVPVSYQTQNGQWVSGIIDLLVETSASPIVVDHKSFPNLDRLEEKVLGVAPQLAAYAEGVSLTLGKKPTTWIHFPTLGRVVEVAISVRASDESVASEATMTVS